MTRRWLLKAVLSLGYWSVVALALVALFTGDVVDADGAIPDAAGGPWPARLSLAGAVLLWAALSSAYDRLTVPR